jgi:hypothetical protein
MAMIEMTTNTSTSVSPRRLRVLDLTWDMIITSTPRPR